MKFKGKTNIREYILQVSNLASKLKALKLELSEDLLMHLVLISLLSLFSQFKVSYNCQKEKWTLNELISYCVQEEERLEEEQAESAHLASTSQGKNKKRKRAKEAAIGSQKQQQHKDNEASCYFFCRKPGHIKNECTKYHVWHVKKCTFLNFVCSGVNLALVPIHTW